MVELREKIARAANDPGEFAGFRGERTMGEWQADAILSVLKEHGEERVEEVARAFIEAEVSANPQSYGFERSEQLTVAAVNRIAERGWRAVSPTARAAISAFLAGRE